MDEYKIIAVTEYSSEATLYTMSNERIPYVVIDYTQVPVVGSTLKHENNTVFIGDKEYTCRYKPGWYVLTENWEAATVTRQVDTIWGTFRINDDVLEDHAWRLYTFLDNVYTRGQSMERAIYLLLLFGVLIKVEPE